MKVKIGPYPNHRFYHNWLYNWFGYSPKQRTSIKIHKYDTWSMDDTLAPIILPMLVQLKETKHGAPNVDPKDVPINLRAKEKDVLKYKEVGEVDPDFFKRWDWVLDEMIYAFDCKANKDDVYMRFKIEDRVGMKKEQERISNGFRLFGKYYESLWDQFMTDMFEVDDEAIRNLVLLAKEGEVMDPIDWSELNITEDQAYIMMATHVLEMDRNHLTDGAIIVKLLVENFVLNLKLMGKQ